MKYILIFILMFVIHVSIYILFKYISDTFFVGSIVGIIQMSVNCSIIKFIEEDKD